MKWFDKWFSRKCRQAWQNSNTAQIPTSIIDTSLRSNGLNFTFYTANGGYVIEYHTFNLESDSSYHSLHIITKDQDLGEGIAHIITYEMLKK